MGYQISQNIYIIAFYVIVLLLSMLILVAQALFFITLDFVLYFGYVTLWLFVFKMGLYLIGAAIAVYIFSTKILSVASTATTTINVLKLNERQKKMVQMASKYVGLFLIALLSNVISIIVHLLTTKQLLPPQIPGIVYGIDCCVNIICMTLQFSFASDVYIKYCSMY